MAKRVAVTKKAPKNQGDEAQVLTFERTRRKREPLGAAPANTRKRIECLTEAQAHYYLAMKSHDVTFGTGPAGTGKSYIAVGYACELLMDKEIDQIILTRPMVGVAKTMGFLPGTAEEKFFPYFKPMRDIMDQFLGKNQVDCLIRNEKIQIQPLEFIRGCTFDRAVMIMDESQNCTVEEMMAFLTRMGSYTRVIIDGDVEQTDLKGVKNGLADAIERFAEHSAFAKIDFTVDDIVRNDLIRDILIAYRKR